ncbi:MAG TPA: hypothetical protein VMC61_00375, partial [Methanocella sp.]|nr:hypothetical protein [Methanocella sp.]
MRSVPGRLCSISIALIIALSAFFPMVAAGTLSSPDYVPMPPGDFTLYRSDHFDIYYDSSRITDVSETVVGAERAYATVTGFFGPYDHRIRLILATNHQQYSNILYNYLSNDNLPEGDVASSWGDSDRGTIVIEAPDQIPDFSTVLAHEVSLIALRTKLISNKYTAPQWFSEGLAIYVSGDLSGAAEAAVEESCRSGKLMTVAQMEGILQRSSDPATSANEVSLAYAQAGMLMEYIAAKYDNNTIKLIMDDFAPTGDMEKAFMRHLGYTP